MPFSAAVTLDRLPPEPLARFSRLAPPQAEPRASCAQRAWRGQLHSADCRRFPCGEGSARLQQPSGVDTCLVRLRLQCLRPGPDDRRDCRSLIVPGLLHLRHFLCVQVPQKGDGGRAARRNSCELPAHAFCPDLADRDWAFRLLDAFRLGRAVPRGSVHFWHLLRAHDRLV